jgi:hypothetical protein
MVQLLNLKVVVGVLQVLTKVDMDMLLAIRVRPDRSAWKVLWNALLVQQVQFQILHLQHVISVLEGLTNLWTVRLLAFHALQDQLALKALRNALLVQQVHIQMKHPQVASHVTII